MLQIPSTTPKTSVKICSIQLSCARDTLGSKCRVEICRSEGPGGVGNDAGVRVNWLRGRQERRRKLQRRFICKRKVAVSKKNLISSSPYLWIPSLKHLYTWWNAFLIVIQILDIEQQQAWRGCCCLGLQHQKLLSETFSHMPVRTLWVLAIT